MLLGHMRQLVLYVFQPPLLVYFSYVNYVTAIELNARKNTEQFLFFYHLHHCIKLMH